MFELESAQKRLSAIEQAQDLLDDITDIICDAGIKNVKVAKAVIACRKEFTDYLRTTEYAITRREKHAHDQSARKEGSETAKEEMPDPGVAALPAEEGRLSAGVRRQAEEAEQCGA